MYLSFRIVTILISKIVTYQLLVITVITYNFNLKINLSNVFRKYYHVFDT